ncbi:alpha-L-arabinofuranosidase [Flagellimonas taeanensis]|jgi:alpha-N-arabinofuranosidase|uniref:alpha-L-arabinofuranosidase C-terminal domain-containing protein n=1 Tax=Flavobacteriaceae TaxID=49546 RepID=UPI000E67EF49|nr:MULTISPECIES: alpha-L-arabinofuranosidase C-terminal domain-containing protein [Allomuricauda]MDC6386079.1 alpha-L-arabinofuranosidase C-terminal domain-containing protein [Muricauda sp. SK9]MEE1963696.1 alpha-L-arabinofuranosidase C-terminal domain-containing protein [Allomuricauda taeanensis]RIV50315.1 alpha-L-arabinofuranosidase [Allomuricauda taeanensis]
MKGFSKVVFLGGLVFILGLFSCKTEKGDTVQGATGEKRNLAIDLGDTGIKIQPTMYGIFYEDINFAADGGLYAELIKNRSFEFPDPKMGWEEPNSVKYSLNKESGFSKITDYVEPKGGNKRFSHTVVQNDARYELFNTGFRGIGLKKDASYHLSIMLANATGVKKLKIALVDTVGTVLASSEIIPDNKDWKTYERVLVPNTIEEKAKLKITFEGNGSIDMDMLSLFPKDTWKGRRNGLRKDLVELLEGLNPGFLRFPGGCIVEGKTLDQRYQWQNTVGPVMERELLINRWNNEFAHKSAPDYYQTFGLGFFEYFQLAEDLGAQPVPILGCGMACQFNSGELVPLENLGPFVQEALDLIEFANGNVSTPWGKLRGEMGHPEAFNMKYLGIGNEQWGPEYFERYKIFAKIIGEKHPEIILVSTPGPFPDGDMFDYGWEQMRELNVALADEHYYKPPEWFLENANRYDSYDRNGPKVFAGEYAAHPKEVEDGTLENNWRAALSEAAFMTGLERNADLVHMTSYAPLMAHAEGWQWAPDLIWFNNLDSYGTVNYQVQKLYSNNAGTDLLKITEEGKALIGQDGLYASAVKDADTGELIIKIINTESHPQQLKLVTNNGTLDKTGAMFSLQSSDLQAVNSFEFPNMVSPKESTLTVITDMVEVAVEPYSVNVLKIKIL